MKKEFLKILGFVPKENSVGIYFKKYSVDSTIIEVDLENNTIKYHGGIKIYDKKNIQNISKEEDWVVLECVDRLLGKGYKSKDILLEKVYPSGHRHSGRLDILVTKEGKAFLMIECKTWGKEFDKELNNIYKKGGQLFTYFQADTKTNYLVLYTSQIHDNQLKYKNEIIKIEDHYRNAGNVEDVFDRWNKITNNNGIFENWIGAYEFQNKYLIKKDLKPITEEDSSFIFHSFLSILRKHSISDKPNAFNKIFNLFLAKIFDEQSCNQDEELKFQWKEKLDDPVEFQVRLIELHKGGMLAFLEKEIEGIPDFKAKGQELKNFQKKVIKFNKIFDIKEVMDDESFDDNFRVLKEIVELLQQYQIRYPRKQQYLSDFFERLLTTGLKQEAGQFFTPPPITKFIIKSIPLREFIKNDLDKFPSELPSAIDYATGSGHFITEILEEYQDIINNFNSNLLSKESSKKELKKWQDNPYEWASKYIFGIEKDYRLVKVAKVGCYFYGDGLAQIIHGDGLDSFNSKNYRGLLTKNQPQFSIVVSNPPYSVDHFKGDLKNIYAKDDFELYKYLTDNSSEIESLFVERTKQLLKNDGVAGIVLPSTILNNAGIYTKTREILLKNFEFIAITEFGSNAFMATSINTITLFLRKRNIDIFEKIENGVNLIFSQTEDLTTNGIEKPTEKYLNHSWNGINVNEYITLLKKEPNKIILEHENFMEYAKKLKYKNEKELYDLIVEKEKEKFIYFILAYNQKLVIVKSGEKEREKRFLGYEFSNRRGSEGMHPIQRGKTIEGCTKLFDIASYDNPQKASTYIYKAFEGDKDFPIDESIKEYVFRLNLIDMITWDRVDFEKTISLSVKKKLKIKSKWEITKIGKIATTQYGYTDKASNQGQIRYLRITDLNDDGSINLDNDIKFINPNQEIIKQFLLKDNDIVIARSGSVGKSAIFKSNKYNDMIFASYLIRLQVDINKVLPDYFFNFTKTKMYWEQVEMNSIVVAQPNLNAEKIKEFKIPLPPLDIQKRIVEEIGEIEKQEDKIKKKINNKKEKINETINKTFTNSTVKVGEIAIIEKGTSITKNGITKGNIPVIAGGKKPAYFHNQSNRYGNIITVSASGANAGFINYYDTSIFASDSNTIKSKNENIISTKLIFLFLKAIQNNIYFLQKGQAQPHVYGEDLAKIEIPLPSTQEQQKIIYEIKKLENEIKILEDELSQFPMVKKNILDKYL